MPKFTIESTFRVPHYRHTTYEAATFEEACKMAMEDQDWDHQKADYDSSGPEHITGAWEGEDSAYSGPALAVPAAMADDLTPEQRAAPAMLAALKALFKECTMTHKHWGEGYNAKEAQAAIDAAQAAIAAAEGR